ncbi:hypothetical protein [Teichococcus vastitatis]|uniref:Uncharacterized protein n=1 Tax=Teichococcus vastitatis TaxID=2307076 RepID=A0ABS9W9D9_9PROT|nr:hypothetical protein [Pseudoroseomonas vastitatis]MCI0755914.1 hypothetical protein [Pseudoroseomonas vastitatis]
MPPSPPPHRRLAAAIADLHRALLNAQAAGTPLASNPYALLQAVMHDPAFAWLRAFSNLLLHIDEAGAKGAIPTPEALQGFVTRAAQLVDGGDPETATSHAMLQMHQLRPEIAGKAASLRQVIAELRDLPGR